MRYYIEMIYIEREIQKIKMYGNLYKRFTNSYFYFLTGEL